MTAAKMPPDRVTLSHDKYHGWWECGGDSPKYEYVLASAVEQTKADVRQRLVDEQQLREQLVTAIDDRDRLRAELAEAKQHAAQLQTMWLNEARVPDLEKELAQTKADLRGAEQREMRDEVRHEEALQRIAALESELAAERAVHVELRKAWDSADAQRKVLESELARARPLLDEMAKHHRSECSGTNVDECVGRLREMLDAYARAKAESGR